LLTIQELLWFISGSTSSLPLSEKGVHIWDGNGSRAFLDSRGLSHRKEGDLGPVYGFQWRHFGAEYVDCETDYKGKGVDQLADCIWKIKNNPTDRRIVLSAWNPAGTFLPFLYKMSVESKRRTLLADLDLGLSLPFLDLGIMALPPCHMFCQFYVTLPSTPDSKPLLSCLMYQRSCDLGLGIPFNIASYSLLTHMIALVTDTVPHEFILQMGDAHVYRDHVDALKVQIEREPREFPKLVWARREDELKEGGIDGFKVEDFRVEGYKPMAKLEMKMSV
jgi:thymidylate synthase